jgi:hypothetical protein
MSENYIILIKNDNYLIEAGEGFVLLCGTVIQNNNMLKTILILGYRLLGYRPCYPVFSWSRFIMYLGCDSLNAP